MHTASNTIRTILAIPCLVILGHCLTGCSPNMFWFLTGAAAGTATSPGEQGDQPGDRPPPPVRDICQENALYGDGLCHLNCTNPDPDCDGASGSPVASRTDVLVTAEAGAVIESEHVQVTVGPGVLSTDSTVTVSLLQLDEVSDSIGIVTAFRLQVDDAQPRVQGHISFRIALEEPVDRSRSLGVYVMAYPDEIGFPIATAQPRFPLYYRIGDASADEPGIHVGGAVPALNHTFVVRDDEVGLVSLPKAASQAKSESFGLVDECVDSACSDASAAMILIHGGFGKQTLKSGDVWDAFLSWAKLDSDMRSSFRMFRYYHNASKTVHQNADELQSEIATVVDTVLGPDAPIVLMCHSRGGLVARALLDLPGVSDRIVRVITLGTPHDGSPFAVPLWASYSLHGGYTEVHVEVPWFDSYYCIPPTGACFEIEAVDRMVAGNYADLPDEVYGFGYGLGSLLELVTNEIPLVGDTDGGRVLAWANRDQAIPSALVYARASSDVRVYPTEGGPVELDIVASFLDPDEPPTERYVRTANDVPFPYAERFICYGGFFQDFEPHERSFVRWANSINTLAVTGLWGYSRALLLASLNFRSEEEREHLFLGLLGAKLQSFVAADGAYPYEANDGVVPVASALGMAGVTVPRLDTLRDNPLGNELVVGGVDVPNVAKRRVFAGLDHLEMAVDNAIFGYVKEDLADLLKPEQPDDEVRSKNYQESVGFWIPDVQNGGRAADELRVEVASLAIDAFIKFGLNINSPWLIIIDVVQLIPSVGYAAPSYDYYVKTEGSSEWAKSVTICPDDEVLVGLAYDAGFSQDLTWRPPHFDGLSAAIRTSGNGPPVDTLTILRAGEETGVAPFPNFFVVKEPVSFESWLDPEPLPFISYESFEIGALGSTANVRIDLRSESCENQALDPTDVTVQSGAVSDEPYSVTWQSSSLHTRYRLQEATNEAFLEATEFILPSTQTSRTFSHAVDVPTMYYYRVRAENQENGLASDWSPSVSIIVRPPEPEDPQPVLVSVSGIPTDDIIVGESFTVMVTARNDGGFSEEGAINASVRYSDGSDDVAMSDPSGGGFNALIHRSPGQTFFSNNCAEMTAQDHLVEAVDNAWQSNEQHMMSFTVTPEEPGTLWIRVRTTMASDIDACDFINDASVSGGVSDTDQQGWTVRRFAVTVNPAPVAPPNPDLVSVAVSPSTVQVGESFTVTVTARNDGGTSPEGAINASVRYSDGSDDVSVNLPPNSAWGDLIVRSPGETIYNSSCCPIPAADHLIEAVDYSWTGGEQKDVSFGVTPQQAGTLWIRVRTAMDAGASSCGNCNFINDASASGGVSDTDQQGWTVRRFAVTVNPAPVAIFTEGFEGAFPGPWTVADNNPQGTNAFWNDVNSSFGGEATHSGGWKGYCAGVGHGGSTNNPTYQPNMDALMTRSVDLGDYSSATLEFWYKMPSRGSGSDRGQVGVITSGVPVTTQNFETVRSAWTRVEIDLSAHTGRTGLTTILIRFESDSTGQAEGWYLDDIALRAAP